MVAIGNPAHMYYLHVHTIRSQGHSRRILSLFGACAIAALLSPAAIAATTLEVLLPAKATTAVPFTFTVTARAGSAVDGTYAGTVHFASSDPGAALPAEYAFTPGDAGSHQFTATMSRPGPENEQSGTRTITATDTMTPSISGTGSTVVWWNENAVRHLHIVDPGPVARAVPFQTEVWALNAYYMEVTYAGTVHFVGTNSLIVPPDYTFAPADNGKHTFTFTPNGGGSAWLSVTETADSWVFGGRQISIGCPAMTVTAGNGGPVCPSEHSSSLHATCNQTGVTYRWNRIGSLNWSLDGADQTNVGAGTYVVTVQNAQGCVATAQTEITTYPVAEPQIVVPETSCGTVHVSLSDSSPFTNIEWRIVNGSVVHGQGSPSAEVDPAPEASSGGLWIRLTADVAGSGCHVESTSHRVAINGGGEPEISTPATTCPNSQTPASVEGSTGATYSWSVANGSIVSGDGTRSIEYVANGAGDVTLSVNRTSGSCAESGMTMVAVQSRPSITEQPLSVSINSGQRTTLSVGATGTSLQFNWYRGIAPDRTQPVASGPDRYFTTPPLTTTTSYWVDVWNTCGAVQSATASVAIGSRRRAAGR